MDTASPSTGRRALGSCVLAALVAALVFVATREGGPTPEAEPAVAAVTPAPAPDPGETAGAPEPGEAAEAPAPAAPSFDVVRVSPDGSALVAGRAAPGATVTIRAGGGALAEADADAEGNFVAIFRAAPTGEPQALTLEAETEDGRSTASDEVVMLLPEAPGAAAEAAAAEADAAPAGAEVAAASATTEAEVAGAEERPEVAATAILRGDSVEAAPTGAAGGPREVTLASISYAEQGEVTLAGFGTAGAVLRAYVDDAFAREAEVGSDGRWSMELGDVAAGIYQLRIDQLAADGRVASRVETPFQRDFPRAPQPLPRPGAAPAEGTVTVQPGHNLWTLARLHYGEGVLYTQIFTANRELIRDPDLIYPGQIFAMPEMAAE